METNNNTSNNIDQGQELNQMPVKKSNKTLIIILIVVFAGLPLLGLLTCGVIGAAAIATPKFSDVSERAKENACRANMRTIASQEVIYFATHETYTDNLDDLEMSGVMCPEGGEPYILRVEGGGTEFYISCPNGHGSIDNGIPSWSR